MKVLVTGGTGYIGSHTVIQLIEQGYTPIIFDNLSNSKELVLDHIKEVTDIRPMFIQGDIRNKKDLEKVFKSIDIDAVIHFAGLKSVGESVEHPLRYYGNNVYGTMNLIEVMRCYNVTRLIFSSSATVYGDVDVCPITEEFPTSATNPYGQTKLTCELMLKDFQNANPDFSVTLLRYFNPVGAHPSGLLGEDPNGIPNNLLPFVTQVAVGKREKLNVFGDDYPTIDGTGVRDYIHVMDLADGHLAAMQKVGNESGVHTFNLGSGVGTSVLEMVKAFERASGKKVPYEIMPRRSGDVATCYADPQKAFDVLGWKTTRTLYDMVASSWKWQRTNPNGYE